ncbi:MAG: group II intron reverse transcriptase/maturase, partial [Candidatus Paceibacterota bacterium]
METKLARIAEIAKEKPKERFTSLYHLLNEEMLLQCHVELDGNKAAGIDRVTKAEYEANLEENIRNLAERLKRKGYRPQPVRRTYIPKDEKSMRPLGIPAYEDKIVQLGLNKILQAIYEQDFLNHSYGFRPGRSCHDALKEVNRIIEKGKISYVVDADISGFFTHVDHEWLMKFIELRIEDPNLRRLIVKFLKAGIMEKGIYEDTEEGTPQGSIASPILANIYLHYALDLWFQVAVKKACKGQAEIVRYADDYVCCFQYKEDAERFYKALVTRLAKFSLKIAEEKTKILMFGRFAADNSKRQGLGKPKTFDFLGFTHYCSKGSNGKFRIKRKTSRKKFKAKLKAFKMWLREE